MLGREISDTDIPGKIRDIELKHPTLEPFIKLEGHRGTKPRGAKRGQ